MISVLRVSKENIGSYLHAILEIEKVSFPSPWSATSFQRESKNPISLMYALLLDEVLTGYICFWEVKGEIHLMNLAVHPQKRCKGIGGLLLKKMFESGLNRGAVKVWLEVRPSNAPAIALYKKVGFKEIARRSAYYRDTNEDAIIMALDLSGKNQDLTSKEGGEEGLGFGS